MYVCLCLSDSDTHDNSRIIKFNSMTKSWSFHRKKKTREILNFIALKIFFEKYRKSMKNPNFEWGTLDLL